MSETQIVVVEDNEINAKLLAYQLQHLGYRKVQVFHQAQAALDWLLHHPCDLILTDCQMRPMDGFEFTRQIRQREAGRPDHLHIVAVTAGAMPEALQTCLDAGMDDYLIKPVQLSTLKQMLDKWLHPPAMNEDPSHDARTTD